MCTTSLVSSVCTCAHAHSYTYVRRARTSNSDVGTRAHTCVQIVLGFTCDHDAALPSPPLQQRYVCLQQRNVCLSLTTFATTVCVPVPVCDQRACVGLCCMYIRRVPPHVSSKGHT